MDPNKYNCDNCKYKKFGFFVDKCRKYKKLIWNSTFDKSKSPKFCFMYYGRTRWYEKGKLIEDV